jgi:predicted MPP superfamily phosphohydrolase
MLIILAVLALVAAAALYRGLVVRRYAVETAKAADVRFALVSDLHAARYGEGQADLLRLIRDQKPDAILMAGDMIDDASSNESTLEFMQGAAGIAPCFYAAGSHDLWSKQYDDCVRAMKGWGIAILDGDTASLVVRGKRVTISGIGDPTYGGYPDDRERYLGDLKAGFSSLDPETFNVLIAHRPDYIAEYAKYPFDLVVSGHTHGGQVRVPLILNGLFAPDQGWFPKYAGGLYRVGDTTMIVSRGLSYYPRIPRVFNPPEVCVVTVRSPSG